MSRSKKEIRIRVVGQRRREPDVRRLAKAIIRLSMDPEVASGLLADLEADEAVQRKVRQAAKRPLDAGEVSS